MMLKSKKIMAVVVLVFLIGVSSVDVFGHGTPGKDRAPVIDFENKNVTIEIKMSPSDITAGNFTNAFMTISFLDDDTGRLFEQSTYKVDVFRGEKMLARNLFYAKDDMVTIDIRPNDACDIDDWDEPWKCAVYHGTEHPITAGLYTFGQSNPVIDGAIFTAGGLYHINVQVIGAGSVHSSLLDPLAFDLYVTVAQEQKFWIDLETGQTFDQPKHQR